MNLWVVIIYATQKNMEYGIWKWEPPRARIQVLEYVMYLGMIIRMRHYGSVARSMFFCLRSERGALEAVQSFTQRCSKNPEPGCVVFSWRSY